MELRETKLRPLPDGKTLVDLLYSDQSDPEKAQTVVHLRRVLEPTARTTVNFLQRNMLTELADWMREELTRLGA
ncbi:MAG: hypothetical protein ACHP7N_06225 [Caulobacterales bacterium]